MTGRKGGRRGGRERGGEGFEIISAFKILPRILQGNFGKNLDNSGINEDCSGFKW